MDNNTPQASLQDAKKIVSGKGLFGKLVKLFMGKDFTESMTDTITQAEAQLAMVQSHAALPDSTATQATVLALADTGALVNHNPIVEVTLKVNPLNGAPFEVSTRTMVSKVAIPRVGDVVTVKYNPEDHSQLAIIS